MNREVTISNIFSIFVLRVEESFIVASIISLLEDKVEKLEVISKYKVTEGRRENGERRRRSENFRYDALDK